MSPEQAYRLIADRAETPELSEAYWISDDEFGDPGDNYCGECVVAAPLLPQFVVCHLLALIGVDVMAAQPHEWGDPSLYGVRNCAKCDESFREARTDGTIRWPGYEAKPCRSWPQRAFARAKAARDGGWATEHDGLRTCDFCGVNLNVILTDYAIESELDHWEEHGPPGTGYGWWELYESVAGLLNYWMPNADTEDPRWGRVIAMLTKWGIKPEARAS